MTLDLPAIAPIDADLVKKPGGILDGRLGEMVAPMRESGKGKESDTTPAMHSDVPARR